LATPILRLLYQTQATLIQQDELVIGHTVEADLRLQHVAISRKHEIIQRLDSNYLTARSVGDNDSRAEEQKSKEGGVYLRCDLEFNVTHQEP
jgi:pSer/pThr/pTyr-binding forkhead associated (FHA) protein